MVNVVEDKILLLLDRYHLASDDEWMEVASLEQFKGFHTIALINTYMTTRILNSLNKDWFDRRSKQ